jgi:opacity protein-like surface antigen
MDWIMQSKNWQQTSAIFLFFLLSSSSIFATSTTPFAKYFSHSAWHPVMTLTGGETIHSDAGESKNIPAQNGIFSFFYYAANHSTQTQSLLGGSLGAEFLVSKQWDWQTGLGYYQPSAFHAEGTVTQGVDTESENQYSYKYFIQSHQLLIENKLLYHWHGYCPYLYAGIGAAWNNSHSFNVNIQPAFTTYSNQFQNRSKTAFTYSIGFGIDVPFGEQARLGVGYRFSDLGGAKTGNGMIDTVTTSTTLSQSHLYTNEIFAQFTALIL